MSADISQIPLLPVDHHLAGRKSIAAGLRPPHTSLAPLALIALIAAFNCQWATAQTASPGGQRIIRQAWTFRDGATQGVEALAQTADGYLWLGSESGLFQFDGIRVPLKDARFVCLTTPPGRRVHFVAGDKALA